MLSDSAVEPKVTLTIGGSATERDREGSCVLAGRRAELGSTGLVSMLETLCAAVRGTAQDGAGLGETVGCRVAVDD